MKPLEPILLVDLFPEERAELLQLLTQLSEDEWQLPTVCEGWSVKDVAAHLLGDDVGLLSRTPEFKFQSSDEFAGWEELLAFINQANELWVQACRRMSPSLICKFLEFTGQETYQLFTTLDLFATGASVDWAGPDPAPIWFDLAREYTERWMHQQHIRDAVSQPGLKNRHFLAPLLETFTRALPYTFREVAAEPGTVLKLTISGEAGGDWFLHKEEVGWKLYKEATAQLHATVIIDQDLAWRLFTRGVDKQAAAAQMTFNGDSVLGSKVLDTISIIA